jgi:hypothetical protein
MGIWVTVQIIVPRYRGCPRELLPEAGCAVGVTGQQYESDECCYWLTTLACTCVCHFCFLGQGQN